MDIKILASGSKGNCYKLSDGETSLLLECGIPIKKIKEGLGFKLSSIDACLITHEHQDHAKAYKDIVKCGINCYMTHGAYNALYPNASPGHRTTIIAPGNQLAIGSLDVLPFAVQHDAAEPVGYLIQSRVNGEKLLFATDTYYIKYRFSGLHYIMVECNYDTKTLHENYESGFIADGLKNRLLESHFSLENVKEFLRANDLSAVRKIILLHLSDANSNEIKNEKMRLKN